MLNEGVSEMIRLTDLQYDDLYINPAQVIAVFNYKVGDINGSRIAMTDDLTLNVQESPREIDIMMDNHDG